MIIVDEAHSVGAFPKNHLNDALTYCSLDITALF